MTKRLHSPWWIVVGSVAGLIFSIGPIVQFTFGLFIKPVAETFHSDRGAASVALLAALGLAGVATPIVGRLVDRFGIRTVAVPTIALFATAIALVGEASQSIAAFVIYYALAGLFGAVQTPLIYARAITAAFDDKRGLALGISMAGVGLGAALVPRLAQFLIDTLGWRHAYVALAVLTLTVALPAVAGLVRDQACLPARAAGVADPTDTNVSIALKSRLFWKMAAAFLAVAVASSGVMAHIVPMMTDRGIAPQAAAKALTVGGLALIAGRLIAGYALDYLFAPYVALCFFLIPLCGVAILLESSTMVPAMVAAALVGTGLGAEIDLIAYLQSRYLGMNRFGETYGYLLALFMLGSGIGPFAMGMSFRYLGSYASGLMGFAACLLLACCIMLTFGEYRFGGGRRNKASRPPIP